MTLTRTRTTSAELHVVEVSFSDLSNHVKTWNEVNCIRKLVQGRPHCEAKVVGGDDVDDNDDDTELPRRSNSSAAKEVRLSFTRDEEYDPDKDGEAPTVLGSSASSSKTRPGLNKDKVMQPELLPKE